MKVTTYDCGYGLAICVGRRCARLHLPFPITMKSWRYLWREWTKK